MAAHSSFNYARERLKQNLDKIAEMVSKDLAEAQEKDVKRIFNEAVEDYYDNYNPTVYGRDSKGLYDLLVFESDETGSYAGYDPDNIGYDWFRKDGINNESGFKQYLYDITFLQGYHGGADKIAANKEEKYGVHPSPGTPWYRRPVGYYIDWGIRSQKDSVPPVKIVRDKVIERWPVYETIAYDSFAKHATEHLLD